MLFSPLERIDHFAESETLNCSLTAIVLFVVTKQIATRTEEFGGIHSFLSSMVSIRFDYLAQHFCKAITDLR